eukprot:10808976-Ditylum_brightwellii.AAC.1
MKTTTELTPWTLTNTKEQECTKNSVPKHLQNQLSPGPQKGYGNNERGGSKPLQMGRTKCKLVSTHD